MGITWSSRAHVFPQLDDAGSTRTMIHRRTREKRTICIQVRKVSRANSASLPPAQGIKSFSLDENVFQGLSVLGHFKLHYLITFRRGLDCESICDPPGGQRCAVGSRDLLNLYTNCPLLSRPPVNHRSG